MGILDAMKRKNITIRGDQEKWIKKEHLNLSHFVQDKLDEEMKKREAGKDS